MDGSVKIVRIIAIAFVCVVVSVAGCTAHSNKIIRDMVDKGVNPMDASCAIGDSSKTFCTLRASK